MIRLKTLRLHQIPKLLHHPQNLKQTHLIPSIGTKSLIPIPGFVFSRNFSLSSLFKHELPAKESNDKRLEDGDNEKEILKQNLRKLELELRRNKQNSTNETKNLETFFTEAVGLSEKDQNSHINENDEESKKGLKKLSDSFISKDQKVKLRKEARKTEETMEFKELSPDMAIFAIYLHKKGYLNNANFLPNNEFDASCFENNYGRDFLKFAAEKFAKDHREIYKWLPNNDLKLVVQFGCPSLGRKNVFSAKALRFSFGIQEKTVCNKCGLKDSCKFANQSVWKKGAKNVDLAVVMRVITLYALEAVPTQLQVPDDVKNAVNRLLKEVIRLSEIES